MKTSRWIPRILWGAGLGLLLITTQLPSGFQVGVQSFEEGDFAKAFQLFKERDQAMGENAPASLLFNRALAALRIQKPKDAEISAERAAARGGKSGFALRDFILGNAAFLRAERATKEIELAEGGPRAQERALLHFHRSIQHWRAALGRNSFRPEATHNISLSKKRIQETQNQAKSRSRPSRKEKSPSLTPSKKPKSPRFPKKNPPQKNTPHLRPKDIQTLLQTLAKNEKAKWELRRKQRRKHPPTSGRSW
jgi:hypothetical protein